MTNLKTIIKVIFFFLPLILWFLIYLQGETYLIIYKGKDWSNSLILPTSRLGELIVFLTFFQFSNLVFYLLLKNNFFVKINYVYVLFHLFLVLKVYFFNFL